MAFLTALIPIIKDYGNTNVEFNDEKLLLCSPAIFL